ncbi:sodium- and chloride-dependent betaine transporter-like [Scomber japonicus]|uniref:sodium- and chloride-dependent betaine transporter-like n=1 Tax=Scomber japonicus TaxID=13676 RepID=UPI0023055075|nr:sodium- and chloride-dependent betaine transporter-like [Scomber japonicus]
MTEETAKGIHVEDSGKDKGSPAREKWANNAHFLLSVVAAINSFSNLWSFPYLCYRHGGVIFFIPYFMCLIFVGAPMFFLETALGQYTSEGVVTAWRKICPMFEGVGVASLVVMIYLNIYFILMSAWTIFYLISSFISPLPWSTCSNIWNTAECHTRYSIYANPHMFHTESNWSFLNNFTSDDGLENDSFMNGTDELLTSSEEEFWIKRVLRISDDMSLGEVHWDLALCLLAAWIICYFCIWKGIKFMGIIVYFTATVPYLMLLILFFRGVSLPGSHAGLAYYLWPDFDKIISADAWFDAVRQVIYSYILSIGVLTTLGSYNKYNSNSYRDCFVLCGLNCVTSIFAGLVVFSVLGFLAHDQNVDIHDVVSSGPGLVFMAFPKVLSMLPGSMFWSVLFFLMILLLGVNVQFVVLESVATSITDLFPHHLRKPGRREILTLVIAVVCFLLGLPLVSQGGILLFHTIDMYGLNEVIVLIIISFECIGIGWVYGADRFLHNITDMIGSLPVPVLKYCWMFITPLICGITLVFRTSFPPILEVYGYEAGEGSYILGRLLVVTPLIFIPIFMLVSLHRNLQTMSTPSSDLRQAWAHKPVLTLCKSVIFKAQVQPSSTMAERNEKMMMEEPIGV